MVSQKTLLENHFLPVNGRATDFHAFDAATYCFTTRALMLIAGSSYVWLLSAMKHRSAIMTSAPTLRRQAHIDTIRPETGIVGITQGHRTPHLAKSIGLPVNRAPYSMPQIRCVLKRVES